jgi:predicted HAD superfamily Cof-like phosphohydrolase
MKHLMRDMAKLHEAFEHPVMKTPVSPDDINDQVDDDVKLSFKRGMQERLMLRLRLVAEEFFELLEGAVGVGGPNKTNIDEAKYHISPVLEKWGPDDDYNAVLTADALTDLMVVIVGMGLELGMPLDVLWKEVHRSNMAKVGPEGRVIQRADGKVLKPEGWTPPRIAEALEQPSDAWTHTERETLAQMGMDPGKQEPFRYLVERYNQLENRFRRVVGDIPLSETELRAEHLVHSAQVLDAPPPGSLERAAAALGVDLEKDISRIITVRLHQDGQLRLQTDECDMLRVEVTDAACVISGDNLSFCCKTKA